MHDDKSDFAALIISRRQEEFEALKKARERRLAERRAQKKVEREIARRHEFVRRCRQEVQDRVSHSGTAALGQSVEAVWLRRVLSQRALSRCLH